MPIECRQCRCTYLDPFLFCPTCGFRLIDVRRHPSNERLAVEFYCGDFWRQARVVFCGDTSLSAIREVRWERDELVIEDEVQGEKRISLIRLYQQMRGMRGSLEAE